MLSHIKMKSVFVSKIEIKFKAIPFSYTTYIYIYTHFKGPSKPALKRRIKKSNGHFFYKLPREWEIFMKRDFFRNSLVP